MGTNSEIILICCVKISEIETSIILGPKPVHKLCLGTRMVGRACLISSAGAWRVPLPGPGHREGLVARVTLLPPEYRPGAARRQNLT